MGSVDEMKCLHMVLVVRVLHRMHTPNQIVCTSSLHLLVTTLISLHTFTMQDKLTVSYVLSA